MVTTILRVGEGFRIDDTGQSFAVKIVTFKVGDNGPFSVEIRADEFSAARAQEEIEQTAREIRALNNLS